MQTLSFIIPVYNEEETVEELFRRIQQACAPLGCEYEVIFIDDGSSDTSPDVVRKLMETESRVRLICFRKNFGKAAALDAGFRHASGDVAITMDADLQDDPNEVPNFLAKLDEGYDMVSGWKKNRHDPAEKRIPSKLFNKVTASMSGIPLHDFNCGFKAYSRPLYTRLNVYGEMHRYIPVLAKRMGFSCGEIPVEHHPREHGKSKYGIERYLRGLFDSMTSSFLLRYGYCPMHFFGKLGLGSCAVGAVMLLVLLIQWIAGTPIGPRPLLVLASLLILAGVQFFAVGLGCEMLLARTSAGSYVEDYIKSLEGFAEPAEESAA